MYRNILFLCIYFFSTWFAVESQMNVALKSNATTCKEMSLAKLHDGVKDITLAERFHEICDEGLFINFKFEYATRINYAIVYEGTSNISRYQLDHFIIRLTSETYADKLCGEFPRQSIRPIEGKGMRVNCNIKTLFKAVSLKILFPKNIGFNIAEIEIYSFGNKNGMSMIERGCLESFPKQYSRNTTNYNTCVSTCHYMAFIFAAVNPTQCHCLNNYNKSDELPLDRCNSKCNNSEINCGGKDVYSLYIVNVNLPYYVGCQDFKHLFRDYRKDTTIVSCLHFCENRTYALLKEGAYCDCLENVDENIFDVTIMCNSLCLGDQKLFCGGPSAISIYKTCSGDTKTPCSLLLRCDGDSDYYGVCSKCEEGFIGEHCIEREGTSYTNLIPSTTTTSEMLSLDTEIKSQTTTTSEWLVETKNESKAFSTNELSNYETATYSKKKENSETSLYDTTVIKNNNYYNASSELTTTSSITLNKPNIESDIFSTSKGTNSEYISETKSEYVSVATSGYVSVATSGYVSVATSGYVSVATSEYVSGTKSGYVSIATSEYVSGTSKIIPCPKINRCSHIPLATCFIHKGRQICECHIGFSFHTTNSSCIDINECSYDACDPEHSICNNTIGGYHCNCKQDYYKIAEDICMINKSSLDAETSVINEVFRYQYIIAVACILMPAVMLAFFVYETKEDIETDEGVTKNAKQNAK